MERGVGIPRTKKKPHNKTNIPKPWEEGVELRKQRGKY